MLQTGIIAKKDLNVKSFIYTDHYNYPQPFFLYQNADFTFFKNLISIKCVRLTGFEIIDMHTQT